MSKYPQTAFRNGLEKRAFEVARDALAWCRDFAANNDFPHPIQGEVFHNVQTSAFHGELSAVDTFANPQSREIDVLLELEHPQLIRLLTSVKDSENRQTLEHVGDYEGLLAALRANPKDCLYWAMILAKRGFQSGCEETAKRADIALVPPVTGDVQWLSILTEEEVLERLSDAVKVFVLGESWRRIDASYANGVIYNAIYVATREPSGMPGNTNIRQGDGSERPMHDFIGEALDKHANRFRIPISRGRMYVPFFEPPSVESVDKDGAVRSSPVSSTIISTSTGITFFRIRTDAGRELLADGQRALYTLDSGRAGRKLIRVDKLKIGTNILCANDDGTGSHVEKIASIEEAR